jgi:hypothetical protein
MPLCYYLRSLRAVVFFFEGEGSGGPLEVRALTMRLFNTWKLPVHVLADAVEYAPGLLSISSAPSFRGVLTSALRCSFVSLRIAPVIES